MTGTNDKLRGLFLATLMVLSVFAGTVALSGSAAAAANQPSVDSAVEYGNGQIEVVFNNSVTVADGALGANDVDIYVDGHEREQGSLTAGDFALTQGSKRLFIDASSLGVTGSEGFDANSNVTVVFDDTQGAGGASSLTGSGMTKAQTNKIKADVTTTAATFKESQATGFDVDKTADGNNAITVYKGSTVAIVNDNSGADTDWELKGVTSGKTGTDSEVQTLDTDNLGVNTGETYRIQFASGSKQFMNVSSLNLQATASDTSITDEDDLKVNVSAARGGQTVTAKLYNSDDDLVEGMSKDLKATQNVTFNFGPQNTDDSPYYVEVSDNVTGLQKTTNDITVEAAADNDASFTKSVFADQRGDVVDIPITMTSTDRATVVIGEADSNHFVENVTVEDGNDDGMVTLQFNTYTAGTNDNGNTVYTVDDSDDKIVRVNDVTNYGGGVKGMFNPNTAAADTLGADDYTMEVYAGDVKNPFKAGSSDGVATLSLQERSTDKVTVYTAPGSRLSDLDNAGDVRDLMGTDNVTKAKNVASQDVMVAKIEASGLQGVIENQTDGNADNVTDAFLRESVAGLENDSYTSKNGHNPGVTQQAAFNFTFHQTNPGANQGAKVLPLNNRHYGHEIFQVLEDYQNDTYYVVYDTGGASNAADGNKFDFNFSVLDQDDLAKSNQTVTGPWTFQDAEGSVDTNADIDGDGSADEVTVRAESGQDITGTANVAPGSELTVRVTGTDQSSPFLKPLTTHVQPDGTWTATGDFSDVANNVNFSVKVQRSGGSIDVDKVDGRTTAAATASVTFDDQDSDGTSVNVASVTTSDGGFVAIHRNNASGDIIGTSDYLEAGTATDVSVTLDQPISADTTLVAMPHQDVDGNQAFDAATDSAYSVNGSVVTDSASITFTGGMTTTEQPTTTEMQTTTEQPTTEQPTTEQPTTEQTTTTSGPGFGVAVALIALIAAALLAIRREN